MMCSGVVSPDLVVRALSKGADGVLVLGCHLGECHYMEGNFNAAKRMTVIRNLLAFTGIDPARLRVEWVSSAEAPKLVQIVTDFSNEIKALGPSPLKAVA
jgi:F420-non-reducing hydrogenase iron-sulfur subunit